MEVPSTKSQKRPNDSPLYDSEPLSKKIRYEPLETSQVVFNTESKSRKFKRNLDQNPELQDNMNQHFESMQPQAKVQKTNNNMNPHKESNQNGFFDNSEILNPRKRKFDDTSNENFVQEKYIKTNNNSEIELSRKLPNAFKIHIEPENDQIFLRNSLSSSSNNLNFSQQHEHFRNEQEDMTMEISPDPMPSNSEYVHINSMLSQFHHERLLRGKHIHAQSPKKKFWAPQIDSNEKGLNLSL